MATYLVTGGAGFIGSHIVERLLTDGHRVRVLDNFSTGRRANIDAVRGAGPDRLQVSTADIRDPGVLEKAVAGMEGVFHLAALGSVPRSVEQPQESHAANATGTLNVLVAARDHGVKRVVFAGSSAVYGALEEYPKLEEHPTCPISPYGLTKLMGEHYLRLFGELYGMEPVTLRYFNVFGPRQDPASQYAAVVPAFVSKLMRGEAPTIYGDGDQSRDFTYVENVVQANLLAMKAPAEKIAPGLFNIAAGGRHSVNDLFRTVRDLVGSDLEPIYADPRPGDIRHSQAGIERAREYLGYEPRVSFAQGLERTVEHFKRLEGRSS
jgi:nucleoside-diphosphate-sugar epimerase